MRADTGRQHLSWHGRLYSRTYLADNGLDKASQRVDAMWCLTCLPMGWYGGVADLVLRFRPAREALQQYSHLSGSPEYYQGRKMTDNVR
jgi:hypothetical protein